MSFNSLLPHKVDIERRSLTDDGMGGYDISYSSILTDVNVRIWNTRENTEILPSGKAVSSVRRMAAKKTITIKTADKVIDGDFEYYVIKRYNVFNAKKLHHYEYSLSLIPLDIEST